MRKGYKLRDCHIAEIIREVDEARIKSDIHALCEDPPFRKMNYTADGHDRCSLYEADLYISNRLKALDWKLYQEAARVQAFRCDETKPLAHRYAVPGEEDPWYTAYNLYGEKPGRSHPGEILLLMAHKDSQSWVDSPGAYDNAVGVAGLLEIARILSSVNNVKTLRLLFCNEEHTPWTSLVAAKNFRDRGDLLSCILNVDSIGGKSEEAIREGRKTNAICYTCEEGKLPAEMLYQINERYEIGLEQEIHLQKAPSNDDGSFIKEGFKHAIACVGSAPYGDPNYHLETDIPEHVDVENVCMAVQMILAFLLELDG